MALETSFYVTGGALHRDAASYVRRHADEELFQGLGTGQFCYVLTSRQMGKTSLMVRTATRLREQGATVVVLDLTAIGQNLTAEQWYEGLLNLAGQHLHLEDLLEDFWLAHQRLGPLQRWMRAIREVVLRHCPGQVVIFVDEIDAVRSLPFPADEFFAGIREFYNARAEDAELHRLTFCLLGVATPSDLIRDTRTTPFNIGRRIELHDFTEDEATPLVQGFSADARLGQKLLRRVIHWTGGHPYLTQRLCQAIADDGGARDADGTDRLCEELFFSSRSRESDDNLHFVRDRLLRSEAELASLLELYGKIHRGQSVRDDDTNALVGVLRLSGIVRTADGRLAVRNRIYARVFDRAWVAANMPDAERQRQRQAYRRGQLRAAAVAAVIIGLLGASWLVTYRASENNRRLLYDAQMNLAQQAWESGNIERVMELLDESGAQTDLLGFEWHYLRRLCHSERQRFLAGSDVWSTAFSPDGLLLAAGDNDGTVRLWSVAGQRVLFALRGHRGLVSALAFTPDGKMLVTGGDDKSLRLWETATGTEIGLLGRHEEIIHSVAIFAARNLIISASDDGMIKLWDLQSRRWLTEMTELTSPTHTMALSPDGKTLALGTASGTVELWDVAQQLEGETILMSSQSSRVRALAFTPDGQLLAGGNEDGNVVLWEVNTRRQRTTFQPEGNAVLTLAFAPDGRTLAVGGNDKTVRLWEVASQRESAVWKGHLGLIHSLTFAPDGRTLASGSQDGTVRLWDVSQKQDCQTFDLQAADIRSLAFSPDGKLLAAGASEEIKLFDLQRNEECATIPAHTDQITALAFAASGQTLVTASEDESLKLWQTGAGGNGQTLMSGRSELHAVALSPNRGLLAVGGQRKTVWLLDAASGATLQELPAEVEVIRSLAFSPDGTKLAVGTGGGIVRLWDVARQHELAVLKIHQQPLPINAISFSPNGRTLATASGDSITRLWDVADQKLKLSFKGHAGAVLSLAFAPDGRRLATGGKDKTVKLWEVEKGLELATFRAHNGEVKAVAFSADGNILATGAADGAVKLWRTTQ